MKKLALLAAGVTSLAAAAPSHAATIVFTSGTDIGLIQNGDVYTGAFEAVAIEDGPDPMFMANFTFTTPFSGNAIASAISIALNEESNIDFDSIWINGVLGTVVNGTVDQAFTSPVLVPGGVNTLSLVGRLNPPSGQGSAGFGGNVTFAAAAAVPEPATWAMFILGFGVLGYGLRRRNAQVSATKARLTFA